MALDSIINTGNSTAGKANVDANYNLNINLPTVKTQAGIAVIATQNDAGTVTGSREIYLPRTSDDLRLSVGIDTPLFDDTFNATAQNTALWKFTSSTLTMTEAAGQLNFNPTNLTTSGGYCSLQSYRYIPMMGNYSSHIEFSGGIVSAAPLAGQVMEFGTFLPNAAAAPTDGIYLRITSAGIAGIAINNGGTEYSTAVWGISNLVTNTVYEYKIIATERFVDFYVNNVEIGSINVSAGLGALFLSQSLPISMQFRNTALIGGAGMSFRITDLHSDVIDIASGKTQPQIYSGMGRHGSQAQNGATMGSTSNLANNLAIGTAAALSNTTITAPACIGLGGQATYLPTLTVFTDGILMSYQNPVGSVNQTARTLYITGVRISSSVSLALAGGPLALMYSLAYGHTSVSMATAEASSFTTGGGKAPRRIPLGCENFAATAATGAGSTSSNVDLNFVTPIVINPGEYIAICVKNVGVVTTTGSITSFIGIGSYWE